MRKDIKEVLLSEEEIQEKLAEMGKKITEDYQGKELLIIGVLKGAFVFMADLIRHIDVPLEVDFMAVSSYGDSTKSSGVVRILKDLDRPIENKNILIVEDIIDTGLTLSYLVSNLESRGAESVTICTLLDKPQRRKINMDIKYKGFDIPDEFVIGYGIDYAEKYRNLKEICILKTE